MKVEREQIEKEITIGDISKIECKINEDNYSFALDMIYRYSDPIGSFIREITSNCVDAHSEARAIKNLTDEELIENKLYLREEIPELRRRFDNWSNKNILIKLVKYPLEGDPYIEFHDYGVGFSETRLKTIYPSFFSSTKREWNGELGAWGIGSKSPLGYTGTFLLETRFNGTKRHCLISKGEKNPSLQILSESTTDLDNGTVITIPIKKEDIDNIQKSAKLQLSYFDNISFEGFDDTFLITDEIYKGENFIVRNNPPYPIMHLLIDCVVYPIDLNQINESLVRAANSLPIGITFDIGDIKVGYTRENILYSDDSRKAINDKIEKVLEELEEIYSSQHPEEPTFSNFIKDIRLKTSGLLTLGNIVLHNIKNVLNTRSKNPYSKIIGRHSLFPEYEVYREVDYRGNYRKTFYNNLDRIIRNNQLRQYNGNSLLYRINESKRFSKLKIKYLSHILGGEPFYLIAKTKVNISENLIYKFPNMPSGLIYTNDKEDVLKAIKNKEISDEEVKIIKNAIKYLKVSSAYIEKFIPHIDDIEIDPNWLKSRNLKISEPTDREIEIPCKRLVLEGEGWKTIEIIPEELKFIRDKIIKESLESYTGQIIYGFRGDEQKLKFIFSIIYNLSNEKRKNDMKNAQKTATVLKIGRKSERELLSLFANAINVNSTKFDKLITSKQVTRFVTSRIIKDIIPSQFLKQENIELLSKSFKKIGNTLDILNKYVNTYYKTLSSHNANYSYSQYWLPLMIAIFKHNKDLIDKDILPYYDSFATFIKRFPLLNYVTISEDSIEAIDDYITTKYKNCNLELINRSTKRNENEKQEENYGEISVEEFTIDSKNGLTF